MSMCHAKITYIRYKGTFFNRYVKTVVPFIWMIFSTCKTWPIFVIVVYQSGINFRQISYCFLSGTAARRALHLLHFCYIWFVTVWYTTLKMNTWLKIFCGILHFVYAIHMSTIMEHRYQFWERVCDAQDELGRWFYKAKDIQFHFQCAVLCTQDALCKSFEIKVIENSGFQCGLMDFIVYHCQPGPQQIYIKVTIGLYW